MYICYEQDVLEYIKKNNSAIKSNITAHFDEIKWFWKKKYVNTFYTFLYKNIYTVYT